MSLLFIFMTEYVRSRAGTLQVAGQLSGVAQVPYRWLNSCQEWCRYPTGGWTAVRSGAGTLQVDGQLSGVVQVPYRWLDMCPEWCRYPTGGWTAVRSSAGILQVPITSVTSDGRILLKEGLVKPWKIRFVRPYSPVWSRYNPPVSNLWINAAWLPWTKSWGP